MLKEVLPTGKKIKKLRKQNGLSQDWFSKFAKAIDVSLND